MTEQDLERLLLERNFDRSTIDSALIDFANEDMLELIETITKDRNNEIEELQEELDRAEGEASDLQFDNDDLDTQVSALEEEVGDLEQQVAELEEECITLKDKNDELESQLSEV